MEARTSFRADVHNAASARRFVADVLTQRGFSNRGIENAVLVTSEAVTNAIIHAGTAVGVVVVGDALMARIEVHDGVATPPAPVDVDPEAAFGRGLRVIEAVAEAWGVEPTAHDGKCVWFELRS
ncbi:MAG: ATP-binding protein [Acidimicrobiales bacterium]